jgi:hypothetical protein
MQKIPTTTIAGVAIFLQPAAGLGRLQAAIVCKKRRIASAESDTVESRNDNAID